MSNTALLIIDMQVGLLEDKNYPIYKSSQLISHVNVLIGNAKAAGALIIFIRHTESSGSLLEIHQPGWQVSSALNIASDNLIIDKHTPDCFYETALMEILVNHDISKLVIAGLQSEYCIDTTCRRAFTLGFQTTLISDAHSTGDSELFSANDIIKHHNQVLSNWFVKLSNHRNADFT